MARLLILGIVALPTGASAAAAAPAPVPVPVGLVPGREAPAVPDAVAQLDSYLAAEIRRRKIPGAVFVLVEDGQVLMRKGYGRTSLPGGEPVDPATTCLHVGSVSKVFTATAVAQAVAAGQVDPDADVNTYLEGVEVPSASLRQLLTHTGGYEQHAVGTATRGAAGWQPLAGYLREHPVHRVTEPGGSIVYSSVGVAVAGQAVADAAGRPFPAYLRERLFTPLGMSRSAFPTPDEPAQGPCATGYRGQGGDRVPYRDPYYSLVPGGGDATTTGDDMVRFLRAHLDGGRLDGRQVLDPKAIALTQQRQVSHGASIRGRAYGFSEWYERGHRTVFHDGGAPGFLSRVLMVPEQRLGFFVSHTLGTDLEFYRDLTSKVLELLTDPGDDEPAAPSAANPPASPPDGQPYSGYYRAHELPAGSLGHLLMTLQATRVTTSDDGVLTIGDQRYEPVAGEPPLYWSGSPNDAVTFTAAGDMHRGTATLQRLSWWEGPITQLAVLGLFLLAFLVILVLTVVRRPRVRGGWLWGLMAVANLGFLAGFAYAVQSAIAADQMVLLYGIPTAVAAVLWIPFGSAALALAATVRGAIGWRTTSGIGRGYVIGCAVLATLFLLYLNAWNLIGWHQ